MNHYASHNLTAFSAGSNPVGAVHNLVLETLMENNIPTKGLHSKSWDYFSDSNLDLVITVCSSASKEHCPVFLGDAKKSQYDFDDPAKFIGNDLEMKKEFGSCFSRMKKISMSIANMSIENKSRSEIVQQIINIIK